jgi:hypothetical protein
MKRPVLLAVALTCLAACDTPSAPTVQSPALRKIPPGPSQAMLFHWQNHFSSTVFNPCPPEEWVAIEGTIHVLGTGEPETPTSIDVKVHYNMQGFEGVGLTSGDRYRIIENDKEETWLSFPPVDFQQTWDHRFRAIREGSNDNFWFRVSGRVSIPPDELVITRDESECRG